jgi:choline dehydrogenase-like flavoprotein
MAIYYAMIVPTGQGSIRALPGFRDPLVRFRLTREDLAMLATAVRRLCQLLFAAGAVRLYPSITGFGSLSSPLELSRIPELIPPNFSNLMTIHLFSSCPMGENDRICPVDSYGRVKEVSGLHIADASLLPSAPGVNPQGSVMAFSRRNALKFANKKLIN